jgi:hypothetical protein
LARRSLAHKGDLGPTGKDPIESGHSSDSSESDDELSEEIARLEAQRQEQRQAHEKQAWLEQEREAAAKAKALQDAADKEAEKREAEKREAEKRAAEKQRRKDAKRAEKLAKLADLRKEVEAEALGQATAPAATAAATISALTAGDEPMDVDEPTTTAQDMSPPAPRALQAPRPQAAEPAKGSVLLRGIQASAQKAVAPRGVLKPAAAGPSRVPIPAAKKTPTRAERNAMWVEAYASYARTAIGVSHFSTMVSSVQALDLFRPSSIDRSLNISPYMALAADIALTVDGFPPRLLPLHTTGSVNELVALARWSEIYCTRPHHVPK